MTTAEKYKQERQKLELNRSLDWSSCAIEYVVAGEKLLPMTVQTWFDLMIIKSPIVTGDEVTIDAIVDYLWRNSKRFCTNPLLREWRMFWMHRRIMKALKTNKTSQELVSVFCEHVKSSFDELPESNTSQEQKRNAMQLVGSEVAMIDEVAHRYGINPLSVLKMPLRQVFALQKVIRLATIPEYKILEPNSLRKIKSEYLKKLNQQT